MGFQIEQGEESIKTLSDIISAVEAFSLAHGNATVLLRGHFDSAWQLKPTLGRPFRHAGQTKTFEVTHERDFVHRFIRHSYSLFGRPISTWEAYLLGRQHGLPVRLLDWTGNPLMALYFAVTHEKPYEPEDAIDGEIWALARKPSDNSFVDVLKGDPFDVHGIKVIYPLDVSPRLIAQGGVFTIQPDGSKPLDEYAADDFVPVDLDIVAMRRWRVDASRKNGLLRQLHRANISRRAVFPDLDGVAASIWQDEFFRGARHL